MKSLLLSLVTLVTVAIRGVVADAPIVTNITEYQSGKYGRVPQQKYHSTDIVSPIWLVNTWDKTRVDPAPYILAALPKNWVKLALPPVADTYGPYIFSADDLSLVYANASMGFVSQTRIQEFNGKQYLTYFSGVDYIGHAWGECYFLNSKYEIEYVVKVVGDYQGIDLHECQVTKDGTALVSVYYNTTADLTAVGLGPDDAICDGMIQEIDIATGELLFEWKALDHYPILTSIRRPDNISPMFEWFHLNSIEKTASGNYLWSSLGFGAVGYINGTTGDVIWTLGGIANNFSEPLNDGATQMLQHDARFRSEDLTQLTIFNNNVLTMKTGCTENCSSGRWLELDYENMTAKIVRDYFHPRSLQAGAEGNYDILPNGNSLVGWGVSPTVTEHITDTAECIFNVQFGIFSVGPDNYRTYKAEWLGEPSWPPSIAATGNGTANSTVWVSWNGATEVKKWLLLGSNSLAGPWDDSSIKRTVDKTGFETAIPVNGTAFKYARVSALNSTPNVIGTSGIVELKTGIVTTVEAPVNLADYM